MVRIGFVIRGTGGDSKYYTPNIKWFVDLSYGLRSIEVDSIIYLHDTEIHLLEKIRQVTKGLVPIELYNEKSFDSVVTTDPPDYVVIDDNNSHMQMLLHLNSPKIKKVVFTEYLYGVNTNKRQKRNRSFALQMGSFLPWRLVTSRYRSLLNKFDFIIANSQTCRYLLDKFYDLTVAGVVYSPVGIDMREIITPHERKIDKQGVLVFVGNIQNDYFSRDLPYEINSLINESRMPVKLWGSGNDTARYFKERGYEIYSNIPVNDLTKLIENSEFTYVPTAYELFGLVGAESLLIGTPVILDSYHPFLELFPMWTRAVKISNPSRKISEQIIEMKETDIDIKTASKAIWDRYSAEESAVSLLESLNISIGAKDHKVS